MDAYDNCLELIDSILLNVGRSNIISKNEIIELRNQIADLQIQEDINKSKKGKR